MISNSFNQEYLKLSFISTSIEINLYGGAVMCLIFDSSRSTQDIDSVFDNIDIIIPLVDNIAKEHNLNHDWFNNAINGIMSMLIKEDLKPYGNFKNINVKIPTPRQMLAMKLCAARGLPKKDFKDALMLCKHLNISSIEEIKDVVYEFIDSYVIRGRQEEFIKNLAIELNKERK